MVCARQGYVFVKDKSHYKDQRGGIVVNPISPGAGASGSSAPQCQSAADRQSCTGEQTQEAPLFLQLQEEGVQHSTACTEVGSDGVGVSQLQGHTVPPVARALGRPSSANCCT